MTWGEADDIELENLGTAQKVTVGKDTVVTEEVKVGKRVVQDTERVSGQVRKEEVKVEQTGDVEVKSRGKGKGTTPA